MALSRSGDACAPVALVSYRSTGTRFTPCTAAVCNHITECHRVIQCLNLQHKCAQRRHIDKECAVVRGVGTHKV